MKVLYLKALRSGLFSEESLKLIFKTSTEDVENIYPQIDYGKDPARCYVIITSTGIVLSTLTSTYMFKFDGTSQIEVWNIQLVFDKRSNSMDMIYTDTTEIHQTTVQSLQCIKGV